MSTTVQPKRKERTIRSETTKVFLVVFLILLLVGGFMIFSSLKGAKTFTSIREVHLQQFKAAEVMKQRGLDIIGIYYLLSSEQDLNIQMEQLQRYDGLVANFDEAIVAVKKTLDTSEDSPEKTKVLSLLKETKSVFDTLNFHCREMTFAMMDGKKEVASKQFTAIYADIKKFQSQIDEMESIVNKKLDDEAGRAQDLLQQSTYVGVAITIASLFITIALITYLMRFLSVSLLPISNLMHNLRQGVFSIDKNHKVISPVSQYSNTVFEEDIVGKNVFEVVFRDIDKASEEFSKINVAVTIVFGEDKMQWMMAEDELPRTVTRHAKVAGEPDKILRLTYTPLWDKQNLVQNIMIVAEDVTELEKMKAEAAKGQGEIAIIHAFIGTERNDIEAMLRDIYESLQQCKGLLQHLTSSQEARHLLFRILHTLKGNSRIFNLDAISEAVHVTEGTVVEVNRHIDGGETADNDLLQKLESGIANVEAVLSTHCVIATKLFGIPNVFDSAKGESAGQTAQPKAMEISMKRYNEIKLMVDGLAKSENNETVKKLTFAVHHAFDYPIAEVCKKLEPMVNDLSERLGKKVKLVIDDADIAIGRDQAYSLRDALVHIIRNSLDHGVETPEDRKKKGKDELSKIEISCRRRGDIVDVVVKDDGRGIDSERVVRKAISLGKITEAEAQKMSAADKLALIFIPNLSTKEEVNMLSGRGVGMDAVKNTVKKLGGTVVVASALDKGTEIHMTMCPYGNIPSF